MRVESTNWVGSQYPPREWQTQALPLALNAIRDGSRQVIQAIMGAGKSLLIAEVVASVRPEADERVVITTSSVDLVDQLTKTIGLRVGFDRVGKFYTHAKQTRRPIIVCCDDSAVNLSKTLKAKTVLLIADECHKTECDTFADAIERFDPEAAVGFTATPFRDSKKASLSHWEPATGIHAPLLYRYGPKEGLRDKVVVPWRIVPWDGPEVALDEACVQIVQGAKGPGIVSASSVSDAEQFAEKLRLRGVDAQCLHYKSGRDRKSALLKQLESGELKCLVAVNMLTEGVDLPYLMWLVLRRNMSSRVAFAQFVGRALRAFPGKDYATLYDPWNLFDTHRISHAAALQGGDVEEEVTEASEAAEANRNNPKELFALRLEQGPAFLVRVVVALAACGVLPEPRVWSGRKKPSTPNQIRAIERSASLLGTVRLPDGVVDGLRDVYRVREALTVGQASDFLNVIYRLPRAGWPEEATQLVAGGDYVVS